MFDSVAFSQIISGYPPTDILLGNGFESRFDARSPCNRKFVYNPPEDSPEPNLTLFRGGDCNIRLRAQSSLPKLFFGSNVQLFTSQSQINQTLENFSNFVTEKTTIEFNAFNCFLNRVDFTKDLYVGESKISLLINELARFNLSRFKRCPVDDLSVTFMSKTRLIGKQSSKAIKIYDKYREFITHQNVKHADLKMALGVARFEYSYLKTATVKRLAKKLKLKNCLARTILTESVAERVMQMDEFRLCLDKVNHLGETKLQKLRRHYSLSKAMDLWAFSQAIYELGEDFYLRHGGMCRQTYKKKAALLRAAGVWV